MPDPSSSSSSAEEGRSAESAITPRRSHRSADSVVLHSSIFGHVRKGGGDTSHCIFYRVDSIAEFTTTSLKKTICGALNTQEAWSIFLGVSLTGKVKGCKITKMERNMLCIGLDNMMRSFTPSVVENRYSITFLPVVNSHASSPGCGVVPALSDVFVVELKLVAQYYIQIYTIKEKDSEGFRYDRCYYRRSSRERTESLSFQELRDLVARKEAEACRGQVTTMKKDINDRHLRG